MDAETMVGFRARRTNHKTAWTPRPSAPHPGWTIKVNPATGRFGYVTSTTSATARGQVA